MEASPTQIIQYFNGEKQNLIPLFQRPYSWRLQNWKALWEDMLVQYDSDEKLVHFMGTIVSIPARSVPVGVSKHLIIDGQQRLTTISILLVALRDVLEGSTSDRNAADRIHNVYLTNTYRSEEDLLKFVPTQIDRDRYRSIVLDHNVPNDNSLMSEAYAFYIKQLRTGRDLDDEPIDPLKVLQTIESGLQVVMINLGENDDPYLIFESLNFKGEPLTQADLVRNYILMRFRHSMTSGGEQERIYLHYWAPMEKRLGNHITEFLRHYAMRSGENVSHRGIYAAIKNIIKAATDPSAAEDQLGYMVQYSISYASFVNPSLEPDGRIRTSLERIRSLDIGSSYTLLLRLFEARHSGALDAAGLAKCLQLIESFVVRRAVCSVPTNSLNKMFLQWARQFPDANHVTWLHKAMSSGGGLTGGRRFPTDSEFSDHFRKSPQYGRGYTRYILFRLEEAFGHKESVNLESATIEHVMPQTMTPQWKAEVGQDCDEVHNLLKDTFGNLSLTAYNTELGNLPFEEKKARLANTHIELNRFMLAQDRWNRDAIERRAEELFAIANRLWIGPAAPEAEPESTSGLGSLVYTSKA
ncbi:hypothetical protein GCM10019059_41820 [Camelimonas fluminis]|nr:hypothetical protein GCM10019059_41820 [Camelimonas fluminis]